jgi:methyl-accepting chemotaxis protein
MLRLAQSSVDLAIHPSGMGREGIADLTHFNPNPMKTTTQLTAAAILLFTSSFINVTSISYLIDGMSDDGRVVNHTGIIRGTTQRLIKLELANLEQDDLIDEVEQIIYGLIEGDRSLGLPPATDPNFLQKMEAVRTGWFTLKARIQEARTLTIPDDRLLQESELFFDLSHAAVFAAEDVATQKVKVAQISQLTLFLLNFVVLVGICWMTYTLQSQIKKAIIAIAASSTEIAAVVTQQEVVISLQAASVYETTLTTTHLGQTSEESAAQAIAAKAVACDVMNLAIGGSQTVEEMLKKMAIIQHHSQGIADKIHGLKERTGRIDSISHIVNQMANQTSLLALNASIEAKRAGIEGRGFSVVATEIRQLATQSKKATEEIQKVVADIQIAMNSTLQVSQEGRKQVQESVQTMQSMTLAFESVVKAIDEVFIHSERIALTAQEQSSAIQQVLESMDSINQGAKETVHGINQTQLGMHHLNQAALSLKTMV